MFLELLLFGLHNHVEEAFVETAEASTQRHGSGPLNESD